MAVPEAARKRLADAEAKHTAQQAAAQAAANADPGGEPSPAPQPSPAPPPPAAAQPPTEPIPQPPGAREENERLKAENQRLQQAHSVLQGKYNAEVPGLAAQVRQLTERLDAVQNPPLPPVPAYRQYLKPEEVDDLGEDLAESTGRIARGVAERAVQSALAPVNQQVQQMREQAFLVQLEAMVPDWREINIDPEWLAWLGSNDPMYNQSRQSILDKANNAGDSHWTAQIFNTFKVSANRNNGAVQSGNIPPHAVPPKAGSQSGPAQKQILKMSDWQGLMRDFTRGKWRGREAEFAEETAKYELAATEGRLSRD